jgi:hypothetical protein
VVLEGAETSEALSREYFAPGLLEQEATTFGPYVAEAAHLTPLLLGRKSERTAKGAANVLRLLTRNAREVFYQLAGNQDAGDGNKEHGEARRPHCYALGG